MAGYLTFPSDRRQQLRRRPAAGQISSLRSSVIAGLALFGLASAGACPDITALPEPIVPPRSADSDLTPGTKFYRIARYPSRVDLNGMSKCQQ